MPNGKRRKSGLHSAVSTPGGLHPLRQTSFPPEESAFDANDVRSPSIDSDITAATGVRSVATTATAAKGRIGRKRKAEGSVLDGKNARRANGEGTSARGGGDDAEEDEDDEDGGEGLVNQGEQIDKATEEENLAFVSPKICCRFCSKPNVPTGSLLKPSITTNPNGTRLFGERSSIQTRLER